MVVGWVCAGEDGVQCLPWLKGVFGVVKMVWDLLVERVV